MGRYRQVVGDLTERVDRMSVASGLAEDLCKTPRQQFSLSSSFACGGNPYWRFRAFQGLTPGSQTLCYVSGKSQTDLLFSSPASTPHLTPKILD